MAITLGTEVALSMHMDTAATYTDVETALVNAGFTDYTISRTVSYDGSCDLQLYVRNHPDSNGVIAPLPAVSTLQALTDALTALDAQGFSPTP